MCDSKEIVASNASLINSLLPLSFMIMICPFVIASPCAFKNYLSVSCYVSSTIDICVHGLVFIDGT